MATTSVGLGRGGAPAAEATLSPEEAERAAAAFVPLWQLDDAPFAAGSKVADDDLRSLSGALTAPLALQLAPPPVIAAPTPEIVAQARALGAGRLTAPQFTLNTFDYVRNNIATEFRFGLAKGGRGALIDQSGTPFDQAELMVKTIR